MTVKESVLESLLNNRGEYLSGEELSSSLEVSRAAVWKAIKSLREDGYSIEAVTGRGYTLPVRKSSITEDTLRYAFSPEFRQTNCQVYDKIDSTNLQAHKALLSGEAGHGDVFLSNQQTAGRGRLGRSFHSPEDGIYLTIVIKPDFDMSQSVLVTVAAAAAVAQAIRDVCGQKAEIKWVNDIYVDSRKVCGILTEAMSDFESGQITSLIIGIGINTSIQGFPQELLDIAGAVDLEGVPEENIPQSTNAKSLLAAAVIENTLRFTAQIGAASHTASREAGSSQPPEFIKRYRDMSLLIGRDIKVYKGAYRKDPTSELGGRPARVLGIDDAGGLKVIYSDGSRETLTTGEVSVRL